MARIQKSFLNKHLKNQSLSHLLIHLNMLFKNPTIRNYISNQQFWRTPWAGQ